MTWLLVNVLIKPGQQSPESREFAGNAFMPPLHTVLGKIGIPFTSTLNLAFLLALIAAGLVWVLVWRTRWGYALRVAGQNPAAAVYAGIRPPRVTIAAMLLSGALAGSLGLNELMGAQHRILLDFPGGAGFVTRVITPQYVAAAEIEREKVQARERTAIDEAELAEWKAKRDELRTTVDDSFLAHYDRVVKGRRKALAGVRDQICLACNVMMRPQTYNELRSGEKLITCDSCGRILYYDAPAEAEPVREGSPAAEASAR